MITLEMHLDGRLFDTIAPCAITLRKKYTQHVAELKEKLLKKHQALLLKKATPPTFILSGIPSRLNVFVPLGTFRH